MALYKTLKGLNPVGYYTFDKKDSSVELYEGTGYYLNKVETDLPPLELKNSGLFFIDYNLPFMTPALSFIENSGLYKCYSSGYVRPYTISSIKRDSSYTTANITQCSTTCSVDLTEFESYIKGSNKYSFFFQLDVDNLNVYTGTLPLLVESDTFITRASFGFLSYFSFVDEQNYIGPIDFHFGYCSYEEDTTIYFEPRFYYGHESRTKLLYNFKMSLPEYSHVPKVMSFYMPDALDIRTRYPNDTSFFRFGPITLSLSNHDSNNYGIHFGRYYNFYNQAQTPIAVIPKSKAVNIYMEIDVATSSLKCYIDKKAPVANIISDINIPLETLSVGIPVYKKESDIVMNGHPILDFYKDDYKAYDITYPAFNVKIDNLAIFNKHLTQQNIIDLYDNNLTFTRQYIDYGYTQLYDFSELYNRDRYYIEDRIVKNLIGSDSYLHVQSKNNSIDTLPYINRYIETIYEYSINMRAGASLMSSRHVYTREQISLIRSTGTVSFSFKTTDPNGLLFANTRYEYHNSNMALIVNNGNIEIWIANEIKSSISGFINDEWHTVHIVLNASTTQFYIDEVLFYTYNGNLVSLQTHTMFGNGLPGIRSLDCEYAIIGFSVVALTKPMITSLNKNLIIFKVLGQITLNNIAVGTYVYICNHDTGELLESLVTNDMTGNFTYTSRYPYSISVIVTDKTLLQGKSYIIDPIEIV